MTVSPQHPIPPDEQKRRNRVYQQRRRSKFPEKTSRKAYMRLTRQDGVGKVYFIQAASGPIKIGFTTKQPLGRLKELQAGNHEQLTLLLSYPASRDEERQLHERFKALAIRREWFRPGQKLLELLRI